MLFRGVLQYSLSAWLGSGSGLVAASLLFGLLHPISFPYVVHTAAVGLYLGATLLFTGNLLTVMVTHSLYDFALMSYLLRYHYRGGPSNPIQPLDPGANIDALSSTVVNSRSQLIMLKGVGICSGLEN